MLEWLHHVQPAHATPPPLHPLREPRAYSRHLRRQLHNWSAIIRARGYWSGPLTLCQSSNSPHCYKMRTSPCSLLVCFFHGTITNCNYSFYLSDMLRFWGFFFAFLPIFFLSPPLVCEFHESKGCLCHAHHCTLTLAPDLVHRHSIKTC